MTNVKIERMSSLQLRVLLIAILASFVVNFSLSNFVVFRGRQPADGRQ